MPATPQIRSSMALGNGNISDHQTTLFTNEQLWEPSTPRESQLWQFLLEINKSHSLDLQDYASLHKWSISHPSDFWAAVWSFTHVKSSTPYAEVVDSNAPMFPRPAFFSGARLNFAENLLYPVTSPTIDPESPALIAATESKRETVSWRELRERVRVTAAALKASGVGSDDRVAGYVGNNVHAVVFMLATTSLGAVWTALSPDSGVSMALDRLQQIEPKLLVSDLTQEYAGKSHDVSKKAAEIVAGLPSLTCVVVTEDARNEILEGLKPEKGKAWSLQDFVSQRHNDKASGEDFEQLPADHPVYILYSSGTTGAPKCIVHGAVGTLIQHKKEHVLQCDIKPGERVLYFTTTTWMMWHWLVSGLAAGATLVLYDGSPMRYRSGDDTEPTSKADDLAMPRLLAELDIAHFGTSAKYLSVLEQKSLLPLEVPHSIAMPKLRAIYSTASPLAPSTFRYVYKAFPSSVQLASITGGTDILSLFGAPSPISPVHAGEIQVLGLGMALRAFDSESDRDAPLDITETGKAGDLVCTVSFPCQPVGFWPLDDSGKARYEASYFTRFSMENAGDVEGRQPVWHQGDFVAFNPKTNGLLMLGRSDGVLNPAGIRFGSAEIYSVLLRRFAGTAADGLCVGRKAEGDPDETVVLFVKMETGKEKEFDQDFVTKVKRAIRSDLSPRHVPVIVDQCPDIPVTVNGKKVEGAVKKILSGSKVQTTSSVVNIDCLDWYRSWADAHPP